MDTNETISAGRAGAQWSSTRGFLLATLGAAVGLGNLWRFPYMVGEHGGAAFIVAYLVVVIAIGWPLLVAELALGRATRADASSAFATVAPRLPWRAMGVFGLLAGAVILLYYPVVAGWVGQYLWYSLLDGRPGGEGATHQQHFDAMITDPRHALPGFLAVLGVAVLTVGIGVQRGIERLCTLLMPLFLVLLLGLALHGLTLEGAGPALGFLFTPDASALLRPTTWLAAIGQAFFSIGLGMGVLITYGSYMGPHPRLPRAALAIVLGDTMIALLAGLLIFPAAYTYGVDPGHGPTLAFVTLPEVFAALPGGRWVAVAFFLLLLIAALTSVVALLEVLVAWACRRRGLSRRRATLMTGAFALAGGLPVALGYSLLAPSRAESPALLDRLDGLASGVLLPLGGLAVALVVGWAWSRREAAAAAQIDRSALAVAWHGGLRTAVPLAIALAMARGLGWI